jgi:hypothetical protein
MSTTAEGVESAGQLAKLRDAGYVFSPPRPAHEIVAMFESRLEGHENGSVTASARASDPRSRIAKRRVNG